MNGGPYRAPQPADRRVINRAAEPSAYRQPEEPQSAPKEEPRVASRPSPAAPSAKAPKKKSRNGLAWTIGLVVFALLVGIFGGYVLAGSAHTDTGIDGKKYQAVYLMNGQLYFGKLSALDDSRFKLESVYYLQAGSNEDGTQKTGAATATDAGSNFQLIKLSGAIYGPSDEMVISKDQVLYYQNLDADSKASQLIDTDK